MKQYNSSILKQSAIPNLLALAKALHPNRHIEVTSQEIRVGNRGSLCIDRRDGKYFDHECGGGGDIYDLIQHSLSLDFKGAVDWLANFIGRGVLPVCNFLPKTSSRTSKNKEHRQQKALHILRKSDAAMLSIVKCYLTLERGIDLEEWPSDVCSHAGLYHYGASKKFPALVAALRNAANEVTGVQSVYLNPDTGKKADIKRAKLCAGIIAGSAIKLANHDGSIPRLAICEGLEDALSVMELTGYPAWAVCGAYNYRHQQIPKSIHEVVIAADNDEAGLSAARVLAQRLIGEGRVVRIQPPPDGCKDWNDYLKKKKRML